MDSMETPTNRRDPELTRLYVAVGLFVLIIVIFLAYKALGAKVSSGGLDAPSHWSLLALGLANVLSIATLLFILTRSLAKLYFERRSGILGARIRTRLVVALFAVSILPSLMLFLVGRNFIAKNVERWFSPETEEVLRIGDALAKDVRGSFSARLKSGAERVKASGFDDPARLLADTDLDLVSFISKTSAAPFAFRIPAVKVGLSVPQLAAAPSNGQSLDTDQGQWIFAPVSRGDGQWVVGVFMPKDTYTRVQALEQRYRDSVNSRGARDTIETLPQHTFLLLTVLTLFLAVWIGLTLARSLSEPIRALAKAAQRVGAGDLMVELQETGEDELAFLSRNFNGMIRDLRSSREAIEAQADRLERQRAYLDQLLAALPVGVLSWRADGELRTLNAIARELLGLEKVDLETASWSVIQVKPGLGKLPQLVASVRDSKRGTQEEIRLGGEGEGRPVRVILEYLIDGGVLAVLEDLSLLAQAEKRAAWQEVARRMAHEVKNPLTPIQLTAQRLLRRGREGKLDPRSVQEGAETILAEVTSLSRLVDSFTRFARLPSPQFTPCDAVELLQQVAALYEPNHPGIVWKVETPAGPIAATWDADMVKRALINLVDNAVGALATHEDAEHPAIRKRRGDLEGHITLRLTKQSDELCFDVEDDGDGVPEDARDRLFEPYFSTKRKGTGLGLAIVRKIAQDHGGTAQFEQLADRTRFRLCLPIHSGG
jgi:two-component system, NtrC family, nitrogen regulation sensor histidine kinase NtrY